MKKLLLAAVLSCAVPAFAFAQSYPAPTFNALTLQNPLSVASGGTGATTSTGTGPVVLANGPTISLGNATGLPNTGLVNSTITLGNTTVSLGASAPTVAGLQLTSPVVSGATLSDPRYTSGVFAPLNMVVGGAVNGNAALFVSQATNQNSFPVSATAIAHLETSAAGGATSGFYSECAQDAAGVCEAEEVDTFNEAGAPYSSLTPPTRTIGTTQIIPIGYLASAGSRTGYANNSWAAYDAESNTAFWYVGYYANPSAIISGGYAFADGTNWNVNALGQENINPGILSVDSAPALSVESTTADKASGALIQMLNNGTGVPTPSKSLRVDQLGNFDILNNAFTTNILSLSDAGTLTVPGLAGTVTNGNAAAGTVGENIASTFSGVSISVASATNVGSVSLTPGDWDCRGNVGFTTLATAANNLQAYVTTTSVGGPSSAVPGALAIDVAGSGIWVSGTTMPTGTGRVALSATTTVYLVGYASGGGTGSGYLSCRRVR
jgi:hypothetical protein